MQRTTRFAIALGILTLALAVGACGDKGTSGGGGAAFDGGDSPQDLIDKVRPYAEANDFRGVIGAIAPEQRSVMAFMGIFMAKMVPAMSQMAVQFAPDEAAKKEAQAKLDAMTKAFDDVMKKHGVDMDKVSDEQAQGMMAGGEPDVEKVTAFFKTNFPSLEAGAFLTDIFGVMKKHGDPKQTESMSMAKGFNGTLENAKVDGDRATGTVDGEEVSFVKIGGRWYVDMAAMMKKDK